MQVGFMCGERRKNMNLTSLVNDHHINPIYCYLSSNFNRGHGQDWIADIFVTRAGECLEGTVDGAKNLIQPPRRPSNGFSQFLVRDISKARFRLITNRERCPYPVGVVLSMIVNR
ncbi:MAG: hypothetical protein Q9212_001479 [Teloschistes hypoglaucus]